jgi:hypothetical protein
VAEDFRTAATKKVQEFAQKQIHRAPPELGPCTRLVLRHLRADGSTTHDIETIIVDPYTDTEDAPGPEEIERYAGDLVSAALSDADGLNRGIQRYAVLAFHDKSPGEATSRCTLRVSGGRSTWASEENAALGLGEIADSEGPTPTGIAAQSQRHVEAMLKMISQAWHHTMGTFADQNQAMQRQMSTMLERHFQMVTMYEQMLSQQHQRDLESRKAEIWVRGADELLDKLKILLPHAINKATGKKLLPTRSSPGEQELVAVIEALRPEQLEQLKDVLTPEQFLATLSIVERVMKEQQQAAGVVPIDAARKPEGEGSAG